MSHEQSYVNFLMLLEIKNGFMHRVEMVVHFCLIIDYLFIFFVFWVASGQVEILFL